MQTSRRIFTSQFILVFFAQLAFNIVWQLLLPTLPIYLKKLGSTEIEIGTLVGILALAGVVCRPFVGKALLRLSEKAFMTAGAVIYAVTSLAYLVIPPFWPLLILRMLQGVGGGFFHTSSTTYVINISTIGDRARIIGYFALTVYIAGAIAPPLGMVLVNNLGFTPLFLVCTIGSLSMLLVSGRLNKRPRAGSSNPTPEDDGFLLSRSALPPSIIGFLTLFIWASIATFFPLYARSQGVDNPGLFFTAMATMLILSRALGGRILDYPRKRVVIIPCILVSAVALTILSLSRSQPMFLFAAALWGAGHAFFIPSLMTLSLERAGSAPGPVVATFYTAADVGMFLGPLIMGIVVQYTNYPFMFFCLAIICFISLAYFCWFTRKKKGWRK
jgi:predicted MFS family arabinose efflux permease